MPAPSQCQRLLLRSTKLVVLLIAGGYQWRPNHQELQTASPGSCLRQEKLEKLVVAGNYHSDPEPPSGAMRSFLFSSATPEIELGHGLECTIAGPFSSDIRRGFEHHKSDINYDKHAVELHNILNP